MRSISEHFKNDEDIIKIESIIKGIIRGDEISNTINGLLNMKSVRDNLFMLPDKFLDSAYHIAMYYLYLLIGFNKREYYIKYLLDLESQMISSNTFIMTKELVDNTNYFHSFTSSGFSFLMRQNTIYRLMSINAVFRNTSSEIVLEEISFSLGSLIKVDKVLLINYLEKILKEIEKNNSKETMFNIMKSLLGSRDDYCYLLWLSNRLPNKITIKSRFYVDSPYLVWRNAKEDGNIFEMMSNRIQFLTEKIKQLKND